MIAATAPNNDIRNVLTEDDLKTLRAAFDNSAMIAGARAATIGSYPPSAPFVDFLLDHFYGANEPVSAEPVSLAAATRWPPSLREGMLVGLLSSKFLGSGLDLAIHLYWALMETITVEQLADILLLVGVYTGMENFTNSLNVLKALLVAVLKPAAAKGGDPSTNAIVGAMVKAFG